MSENSKNWGVNIERENLLNNLRNFNEIFRKTFFLFLKNLFSGLSIKSHKKNRLHSLSLENTNLEQVTTTVKIWSERELSKVSNFSILGTGQNFCLSLFLSFLNIKLQQLSKFEVREHFPGFPSFLYWV